MTTLETLAFNSESLSIERFMSLTEKEKENISSIKIIPPSLIDFNIDDDFGKIEVNYKLPIHKTL
jgi:hypothetical protein